MYPDCYGIHNFLCQFCNCLKVSYSDNSCHHIQNKRTLLVWIISAGEYLMSKDFSKSDFGLLWFIPSAWHKLSRIFVSRYFKATSKFILNFNKYETRWPRAFQFLFMLFGPLPSVGGTTFLIKRILFLFLVILSLNFFVVVRIRLWRKWSQRSSPFSRNGSFSYILRNGTFLYFRKQKPWKNSFYFRKWNFSCIWGKVYSEPWHNRRNFLSLVMFL